MDTIPDTVPDTYSSETCVFSQIMTTYERRGKIIIQTGEKTCLQGLLDLIFNVHIEGKELEPGF